MKKLILLSILLIVGCNSNSKEINNKDPNDDSNIMVRVINKRSDSTKTIIGSTNYGIIASRDTSDYKSVQIGNNDIYLNDEYIRQSLFSENQPNTIIYFTYILRKSGHGIRMDISKPEPCNNDGICKWRNGETDSHCPKDCQFDSDYLGKYACQDHTDCDHLDEYPFCFIDYCSQPSNKLIEFTNQHYYTIDCDNIPCDNCTYGKYVMLQMGYNDFSIELCTECSNNSFSSTFCNFGYTCKMGLCVSDSN